MWGKYISGCEVHVYAYTYVKYNMYQEDFACLHSSFMTLNELQSYITWLTAYNPRIWV